MLPKYLQWKSIPHLSVIFNNTCQWVRKWSSLCNNATLQWNPIIPANNIKRKRFRYLHLSVIFSVQVSHSKHQASALNCSTKDREDRLICQGCMHNTPFKPETVTIPRPEPANPSPRHTLKLADQFLLSFGCPVYPGLNHTYIIYHHISHIFVGTWWGKPLTG